MAEQKNHKDVAFLTKLAGITVPEGRLPALAAGLGGTQAISVTLARIDLGGTEIASRFVPPASR